MVLKEYEWLRVGKGLGIPFEAPKEGSEKEDIDGLDFWDAKNGKFLDKFSLSFIGWERGITFALKGYFEPNCINQCIFFSAA